MAKKTLFTNVRLIDGTGSDAIEKAAILVDGEVVESIWKDGEFQGNEEMEVVDLTGKTVMPGMINSHVHILMEPVGDPFGLMVKESHTKTALRAVNNLKKQLKSGVTFFRDLGGLGYIDIELKKAVDEGLIQGPEFLASGKPVVMTGGHGWQMGIEANGCDETRAAAREQLKAGADVIKIMATGGVMTPGVEPGSAQLTMEEMKVAVEEAHKAGKKTASHAQGTTGIKNAILAGIDSIEHGIFLDDEAIQMMIDHDVYLVPTLVAPYFILKYGVEAGVPEQAVEKCKRIIGSHQDSFRRAHKAGVKIAMGTDCGTPFNLHDSSAYELKLMVECGMTPMESIIASTKSAAELLGINEKYGTLEQGKVADFIVLDENPLQNIETLLNVRDVYKKGKLVK